MANERLMPFRDYDEHDVINLFAFGDTAVVLNDSTTVEAGSVVKVKTGWKNTDETQLLTDVGASYNNVANTPWSFSPSFVWSHDISGYGPTSLGGFVPGRQSLSLSGNLSKGDVNMGLSYVNELGDEMDNLNFDKDYISANVSYAF